MAVSAAIKYGYRISKPETGLKSKFSLSDWDYMPIRIGNAQRDRRKSGEAAMKGWATRRRKQQDRRVALDRLIEVADSIGGELVTRTPIAGSTLCQAVSTMQLINWRDRISSALRILEGK